MSCHPERYAETIGDLVRRVVASIVRKIQLFSPVVMAVGCQGPRVDKREKPPTPVASVVSPAHEESEKSNEPKPIGAFDITFYYVIGEDEIGPKKTKKLASGKPANDNAAAGDSRPDGEAELAAVAPAPDLVTLYEPTSCAAIADVSNEFASQLWLQGTGKLRDGRVLNIWGPCNCGQGDARRGPRRPCFKVTESQWGTSGSGRPLQPFRTVAVDRRVVKLGTLLYVPMLEGRTMPGRAPWGGYVHDGCVVADDTGGGINGNQLDLFVGRRAYFFGLSGNRGSHAWARRVPVFDGAKMCERKGRRVARRAASI